MRRMFIALVLGALFAMLVAGGVALAATEPQPGECSPDVPTWCKGTDASETLTGGPEGDRLEALAGNDTVWGLGGTDALYGQAGRDEIHGDARPPEYPPDKVIGTANWDALFGGKGADTLYAEDPQTVTEKQENVDVLYAGQDDKRDLLYGGTGEDVYVVNKNYVVRSPDSTDEPAGVDVIKDNQSFGEAVPLPSDDRPHVLRDAALSGGPHLYVYP